MYAGVWSLRTDEPHSASLELFSEEMRMEMNQDETEEERFYKKSWMIHFLTPTRRHSNVPHCCKISCSSSEENPAHLHLHLHFTNHSSASVHIWSSESTEVTERTTPLTSEKLNKDMLLLESLSFWEETLNPLFGKSLHRTFYCHMKSGKILGSE